MGDDLPTAVIPRVAASHDPPTARRHGGQTQGPNPTGGSPVSSPRLSKNDPANAFEKFTPADTEMLAKAMKQVEDHYVGLGRSRAYAQDLAQRAFAKLWAKDPNFPLHHLFVAARSLNHDDHDHELVEATYRREISSPDYRRKRALVFDSERGDEEFGEYEEHRAAGLTQDLESEGEDREIIRDLLAAVPHADGVLRAAAGLPVRISPCTLERARARVREWLEKRMAENRRV
jgi:DNA-directed RNA polymerase specialized sigma24 family protein